MKPRKFDTGDNGAIIALLAVAVVIIALTVLEARTGIVSHLFIATISGG